MNVTLEPNHAGTWLLVAEDGRDVLFQFDWDFPGLASSFGWVPCPSGRTDGTVDCAHKTRSEMIADAWDFLDRSVGTTIEDPGYYSSLVWESRHY